jgi:hypothetical protein
MPGVGHHAAHGDDVLVRGEEMLAGARGGDGLERFHDRLVLGNHLAQARSDDVDPELLALLALLGRLRSHRGPAAGLRVLCIDRELVVARHVRRQVRRRR